MSVSTIEPGGVCRVGREHARRTGQHDRFPTIFDGDPTAKAAPASPGAAPVPANRNAWHIAGTGGAGANVRDEPSTTASVLATLPDGTQVEPLGGPVESDGMHWLEVRAMTPKVQGWVTTDLLQAPAKGSAYFRPLINLPTPTQWVVAGTDGAGANLRAQPSTEADIVAVLEEGTPVKPLEGPISADGLWWRKVGADGTNGWIVASYVRLQ